MKLIIVESPTKCHTIGEFLGKDYKIVASKGHIRDLSTSGKGGLGVDVDHGFKPTYIISKDKLSVVKTLKNALKEVDDVYLATDPDREGEAIAWHLKEVLGLPDNTKRMEFHEITSHAVKKALANPRTIDMNLVESQETRRIMDRIIGFKLSGLLNSKIKSRSAGRVQSVTLRLVVDHEREIKDFVPEEYYETPEELEHNDREYDFFISHASEDKDAFVRPFAEALVEAGFSSVVVLNNWGATYTIKAVK